MRNYLVLTLIIASSIVLARLRADDVPPYIINGSVSATADDWSQSLTLLYGNRSGYVANASFNAPVSAFTGAFLNYLSPEADVSGVLNFAANTYASASIQAESRIDYYFKISGPTEFVGVTLYGFGYSGFYKSSLTGVLSDQASQAFSINAIDPTDGGESLSGLNVSGSYSLKDPSFDDQYGSQQSDPFLTSQVFQAETNVVYHVAILASYAIKVEGSDGDVAINVTSASYPYLA
ncbi:MAG TPA: hypothetical protein VIM69_02990, partial [Opitutaceae bacterium]